MKMLSIIALIVGFPFLCAEIVIAQEKLTPQDGFYVPAGMNNCHFNVVNDEHNDQVFLFGTKISDRGVGKLHQLNPSLKVDKGGYALEKLPSDTIEYKRTKY